MKFLHQPFNARTNDRIVVSFSKATKVLLIHASQIENYKKGKTYQYRGGFSEKSPVEFTVPTEGVWHAVIEKGSYKNPIELTGSARLNRPGPATLNGPEQMETHQAIKGGYDDTLE